MKGGNSSFASKYQHPSVEEECPAAKEVFDKVYYDDATGAVLDPKLVAAAVQEELDFMRQLKVYHEVPADFAAQNCLRLIGTQLDMTATVFETCIQQENCESLAAVVDGLQKPEVASASLVASWTTPGTARHPIGTYMGRSSRNWWQIKCTMWTTPSALIHAPQWGAVVRTRLRSLTPRFEPCTLNAFKIL